MSAEHAGAAQHARLARGGRIERPLLFPDNDRLGVMSAAAVIEYVRRYATGWSKPCAFCHAIGSDSRTIPRTILSTCFQHAWQLNAIRPEQSWGSNQLKEPD